MSLKYTSLVIRNLECNQYQIPYISYKFMIAFNFIENELRLHEREDYSQDNQPPWLTQNLNTIVHLQN